MYLLQEESRYSPKCHDVTDFRQRRVIIDTIGWEPFQSWFYENEFRSWWQLNGLMGVPLYRIYKRKNDWKSGGPIEPATDPNEMEPKSESSTLSIVEKAAALAEKYSTQYSHHFYYEKSLKLVFLCMFSTVLSYAKYYAMLT